MFHQNLENLAPPDADASQVLASRSRRDGACEGGIMRLSVAAVILAVFAGWLLLFASILQAMPNGHGLPRGVAIGAAVALHLPYAFLLLFLGLGLVERLGYFWRGRRPVAGGVLPAVLPRVCIQLPMYNEDAVALRAMDAAAALDWPSDRLEIQVLDDSTDAETAAMVRQHCEILRLAGANIVMHHRADRQGYKAGALEAGRRGTDAEFIAIFDADFVPGPDYLRCVVPHFYDQTGTPIAGLGLVQARWGHLNDDESLLTNAQALWVDDHHTMQQSWRSSALDFVNFTGTAGVWRARALEEAGGWRSASLVEDCEISFRALFAGYRTKFLKEVVVPAELPQTIAAYRLQQKRWTQGWAQLQRLHFKTMLSDFRTPMARKLMLAHMMTIGWQWPLWFLWTIILPFLIFADLSLAAINSGAGLLFYMGPPLAFALLSGLIATREAHAAYRLADGALRSGPVRRSFRIIPYLTINAAMLPHHFCAFVEGLFGPLHSEFERTPKTAQVTLPTGSPKPIQPSKPAAAPRKPGQSSYLLTEGAFVATQIGWVSAFAAADQWVAAAIAAWIILCIAGYRLAPRLIAATRALTASGERI